MQLVFMSEALAHEAQAANSAKETRFTVVVGNPPYSLLSQNLGIEARKLVDAYKFLDGERIVERGALQFEKIIQDDYIKFFSIAQGHVRLSGVGTICMITNHSYIDSPVLRGFRRSLMNSCSQTTVLNLHGSVGKNEVAPVGIKDENVFEISQGTAIFLGSASADTSQKRTYGDLWGSRTSKYDQLKQASVNKVAVVPVQPSPPYYSFEPRVEGPDQVWPHSPSLDKVFPAYGMGVVTARDNAAVSYDDSTLLETVTRFVDPKLSDEEACVAIDISVKKGWNVARARKVLRTEDNPAEYVKEFHYRPFDRRKVFYHPSLVWGMSQPTMRHLGGADNVALTLTRSLEGGTFQHAFVTSGITGHHFVALKEVNFVEPLWLKPQGTETRTLPNIAPAFAKRVAALTGLAWNDCVEGLRQGALGGIVKPKPEQTAMFDKRRERGEPGKSFGPRDLFDYIYAVLHSPAYRARYADYLKSDFARIPLPGSRELFETLVPLGTELVALHLLDADALSILKDPKTVRLAGSGEARVAHKPEHDAKLGRVAINATRWFETVPEAAWTFHVGGYQPAQKWLKDRAAKGGKKASDGRILTDADILHYRRMIVALTAAIGSTTSPLGLVSTVVGWLRSRSAVGSSM